MSVLKASSSISSPSWKSIARLALPSRLELNSPEGSLSEAPLRKVSFTTLLYVSPVQISPSCDHTGTPNIAFDGFLHFTSSTTSGSACLMRARTWESVLPLQSSSSLILASISREGDSPLVVALFFILFAHSAVFLSCAPARMRPASVPAFRPDPIARPNPLEQAPVSRAQPHRAHDLSPEDQPRYRHAIRQARLLLPRRASYCRYPHMPTLCTPLNGAWLGI